MKSAKALLMLMPALVAGCSLHARGPEDYRKATRELLDQKSTSIEGCYRRELTDIAETQGTVVVSFNVEAKTGNLVKAKVVDEKTNATPQLQTCVLDALAGLKLDPPDQRTAEATFEWQFEHARP